MLFGLPTKELVNINSFVAASRITDKKESPAPKYFTDEELLVPLPTKKEDILKGFEEAKEGGLICMDKEAMDK